MRKTPFYNLLTWLLLIIGLVFLAKFAPILYTPEYILSDDFGHFWASGKLFIDQENPYDLKKMNELQLQAGAIQSSYPSIGIQTLNPPWSLLIFAPFSLLNYSLARVAWLIVNIMLVVVSVRRFWQIFNGSDNQLWFALLISFCFTPTYSVLTKGQITPWVVLGIVGLCLYFEGKINIWWAGTCLVLISLKPQLFYLLWPTLVLWVISQRRWKLLFTGVIIGLLVLITIFLINHQIFLQYFTAIQEYPYDQWATPTIGSYLRFFWLGVDKFWVQYLPACFAIGWLVFHYLKHKQTWVWRDQLPILSMVSLLTSPYAWTYDQIIILPAILVATHWLIGFNKARIIAVIFVYIAINLGNLLLHMRYDEFWFLWLAPAYTLWCFIVLNQKQKMAMRES